MKRNRWMFGLVIGFTILIITACKTAEVKSTPTIMGMTATTSVPVQGKASVVGKLVSSITGKPLANTIIRLAEVYRQGGEGAYVLDGANSPGAISDAEGNFLIKGIPAQEYVVVVGDVMDVYTIITDETKKAKVFNVEANKTFSLDVLKVDLK
jgi:hypothetical protein